ncbi:SpoIIE family protein phosphatase [Sphaerotilus mobilis]|uniref:Serine/threonine protein phosphatase PrpC n=1 Tax=Sphaerotilus mobilis TaxID=47994 RepID=A0A4Q7LQL1_9BURK|nr:SpoIIE family protein phosphatase [Sphaerotilus mobilis]RZS57165.1 serine/threonine protein phosphatase PrpC [Sphaerotilus mobilis]
MAAPTLSTGSPGLSIRRAHLLQAIEADQPCGDAVGCWLADESHGADGLLAVIDGLGHGPEAAQAAQVALQTLGAAPERPLSELFARLDRALFATRGAAIGLLRIDGQRLLHAGVGNTRLLHWRAQGLVRLVSQNGIVGGGLPSPVVETEHPLQAGDWLLLFTDGLDERVRLPLRLPEWQRDPATLCQHLMQHARAGRDDAGVMVVQIGALA